MFRNWPLLFIIIPLVELYLIIKVGTYIGALWTVILVVVTAVIGINLLRMQGIATLRNAQNTMRMGELPAMEMMEGLALAVGGALLITPGFLTDSIGFLCLIPVTRKAIIRYMMSNTTVNMYSSGASYRQPRNDQSGNKSGRVIEGEYHRKD